MSNIATHAPSRRSISWKRIIFLAVLLLVGLLVLVHWRWSEHANKLFEAQFDEYRRRGEPVTLQDLKTPAVPDEQNAALDLRAAAEAIRLTADQRQFFDHLEFPFYPLTDEQFAPLRELLKANAEVFSKVQSARAKPAVDWKITFDNVEMILSAPDARPQRELTRILIAAALSAHQAGDDHTALQRIDDTLFVADAMRSQPTLIGYLVAMGIESMAYEALLGINHNLRLDSPADRQLVHRLVTRFLDETAPRQHFVRALHSERALQIEVIRLLASGRGQAIARMLNIPESSKLFSLTSNVLRPLCLNSGVVMTRYTTQVAQSVAAPTWPAAEAQIPDVSKLKNSYLRYPLASVLLPTLDVAAQRHYRYLTDRRMAATALAIRLYAIDHNGNHPQSLSELVPAYLPAVPHDPFARDGAPVRYLPAPANPLLYSVGENGVDEQGSDKPSRGRATRVYRWQQIDATYPLIPKPKPPEEDQ